MVKASTFPTLEPPSAGRYTAAGMVIEIMPSRAMMSMTRFGKAIDGRRSMKVEFLPAYR